MTETTPTESKPSSTDDTATVSTPTAAPTAPKPKSPAFASYEFDVQLSDNLVLHYTKKADKMPIGSFSLDFEEPCLKSGELNSLSKSEEGFLINYPSEKQYLGCSRERMTNRTNDGRFIKIESLNVTQKALFGN